MTEETREKLKNRDTFFHLCADMNVSYSTLSSYLSGRRHITPWAEYCFKCFESRRPIPKLNQAHILLTAEETRRIRGDSLHSMMRRSGVHVITYSKAQKGFAISQNSLFLLLRYSEH